MTREELLTPALVRELQRHAREAYPNEAIGIVTTSGYVRMRNVSRTPETHAVMARAEFAQHVIAGTLVAVFHSHPNGPNCPSAQDMHSQMAQGVPFIIVCVNHDGACLPPFAWGDQLDCPPLLGRPFQSGVTDCYELIRDHRYLEYGERLPQFPRSWEWWKNKQSLYLDGFMEAGYRLLESNEPPQIGDGLLFAVKSTVPNHAGVLVTRDLMLHHVGAREPYDPSRLSKREPWTNWKPKLTHRVRRDAP